MKKILCLLLVFSLVFSMLSICAEGITNSTNVSFHRAIVIIPGIAGVELQDAYSGAKWWPSKKSS